MLLRRLCFCFPLPSNGECSSEIRSSEMCYISLLTLNYIYTTSVMVLNINLQGQFKKFSCRYLHPLQPLNIVYTFVTCTLLLIFMLFLFYFICWCLLTINALFSRGQELIINRSNRETVNRILCNIHLWQDPIFFKPWVVFLTSLVNVTSLRFFF